MVVGLLILSCAGLDVSMSRSVDLSIRGIDSDQLV